MHQLHELEQMKQKLTASYTFTQPLIPIKIFPSVPLSFVTFYTPVYFLWGCNTLDEDIVCLQDPNPRLLGKGKLNGVGVLVE